jgi:hypothetical protein
MYTIVSSAGANGSIEPLGEVQVYCGANQSFTITPATNYEIDEVLVDNVPIVLTVLENGDTYTFTNVTANHTIHVTFKQIYISEFCMDLHLSEITSDGCLQLGWQWLTPPTEIYGYTLYQWDDAAGWQTTSINYDRTIKVLNIYPDIAGSNTLANWMNDPNVGLGKILVTPVTISNFNSNPDYYLKDSNGNYQYDVVMFGTWDCNNSRDLTVAARNAVEAFLKAGRGVLFGHDTATALTGHCNNPHSNFNYLANNYMNLQTPANTYPNITETNQVQSINTGFLLKYPWDISQQSIFTIPVTHVLGQCAQGIIWMTFVNTPHVLCNNYYLTTWNNTGMIQTGHSNGQSTMDERRIIANTLWYLAQFSTDTTAKVCSALDLAAPNAPTAVRQNNSCNLIDIVSQDNGSPYSFYVKATNVNNPSDTCKSNTLETINKTGLKGYYVLEDNDPTCGPDISTGYTAFIEATDNQQVSYTVQDVTNYVHIQAIDFAGNLSTVTTLNPPANYSIIASAGPGGNINPSGNVSVNCGVNQTFTFGPYTNYIINQVLVDGVNNSDAVAAGSYTFTNVMANHTIVVYFQLIQNDCPEIAYDAINDFTYHVVSLAGLCWFKENFRGTKYADGEEIPFAHPYYSAQ